MEEITRRTLHVDLETYSEIDIKDSAYRYVDDPSFEIILMAYAFDDEEVKIVDLCQGEEIPEEVALALTDHTITKKAHNANFERTCLAKYLGKEMPPSEWECSAVRASELGLPRSLEEVGEVLGLAEDEKKMKVGKQLIAYFCKPCKPTKSNNGRVRNMPWHYIERWELFKEYCKQDVETERIIDRKMAEYPATKPEEKELWNVDQLINDKGVEVNMNLVNNILDYNDEYVQRLIEEARRISHLENPGSLIQVKNWINELGVLGEITSLTKDTVNDFMKTIEELIPASTEKDKKTLLSLNRFLEIRQELGKTSVAKYEAIKRSITSDGRVHGMLLFYGANRTGRWAGRIVQLQNLPQNKLDDIEETRNLVLNKDFDLIEMFYPNVMDIFSQLIRTSFIAGPKKTLAVADYSAIEARVIAWLADEEWVNEVFKTHGKIYEATAAQMFHVPIESVTKGSDLRKKGKVAQLACGYQGGAGALTAMDKNGDIPEEEKWPLIDAWRRANPHIVRFWYDTENNVKQAIKHPGMTVHGPKGIKYKMIKDSLFVKLPSGRFIVYKNIRIENGSNGKETIKYQGVNPETKRWGWTETYGGKLVENIVQATARDCLGYAMVRLAKAGYLPIFHVHDEVIIEVDEKTREADLEKIEDIMSLKDVEWTKGLVLKAAGYLTNYYLKD